MTPNMETTSHIRYGMNENSFELEPYGSTQLCPDKPFRVSVEIPRISKLSGWGEQRTLTLSLYKCSEGDVKVNSGLGEICIKTQRPGDWQKFVNSNLRQLIGLLSAALMRKDREDFLWVEPTEDGKVWIMGIVWKNDTGYWEGMLTKCSRQPSLDVDFWIMASERDKRKQAARKLFNSLIDKEGLRLPKSFPFCSNALIPSQSRHRQLTIKVHPSELWFLLFPIDHFCQFEYGRFSLYKGVEWIITAEKTFIQNMYERMWIHDELQDIKNFLKHSVIILNTYQHFDQEPVVKEKWSQGTNLLTGLLSLLENVEIEGEVVSLRWYLNPDEDDIRSELRNTNTWYFLADFHAENGKWQTGKGKWISFDSLEKGTLSHIRLMRVFHCHSLGPADISGSHTPIVARLLDAGARRVEGNIMEESYLDHLCSLLGLLCQAEGLELILMGKCLEKSTDFNAITKRANKFLESCKWKYTSL